MIDYLRIPALCLREAMELLKPVRTAGRNVVSHSQWFCCI